MSENIQKIDLNFTNSGGGHSATVASVVDGKSLSGKEGLGTVIGEAGELNTFSNAEIDAAMQRFRCTTLTTSRDATKIVKNRKYVDKTSLKLNSLVVLVRGLNCSPRGGEDNLSVPFYSEVSNSPLESFKVQGAVRKGSVIEVGRIYNVEEASNYQGIKAYLVYGNKQLKQDLSLNLDFVSSKYLASPDLSQFQLKFGYTLTDFKNIMSEAGISVSGLPESESFNKILFQASGTLSSVVGSVASFLGCFWYVDPKNNGVKFVNTAIASSIAITDYTKTQDKNIVSASFTEDYIKTDIVNTYIGSTEKPPEGSGTPAHGDGVRSRNAMFRRVQIESMEDFRKKFFKVVDGKKIFADIRQVLGVYFALFNQEQDAKVFDAYSYVLSLYESKNLFKTEFGDKWKNWTIKPLYPYSSCTLHPYFFSGVKMEGDKLVRWPAEHGLEGGFGHAIYGMIQTKEQAGGKITPSNQAGKITNQDGIRGYHRAGKPNKDGLLDKYINEYFTYYSIMTGVDEDGEKAQSKIMPKPSTTKLHTFLKHYFKMGRGLWISNGYGTYKAERMEFVNSNNMTVVGPFHKRSFVDQHPELDWLDDFLSIVIGNRRVRIEELASITEPKARSLNPWHWVGFLPAPKIAKIKAEKAVLAGKIEDVDFDKFMANTEIVTFSADVDAMVAKDQTFIGGPSWFWKKLNRHIKGMMNQSYRNYSEATEWSKSTALKYNRSKTRVNNLTEEGEEQEDDDIADSSENEQKKSDLFDRYDTKYYGVEAPPWDLMNKLSLASSSGSTLEMITLREQRQNYEAETDSGEPQRIFQSSRSMYGLHIPPFEPQMNSITLNVGSNGVTTNITESTIKLLPPDQGFMQNLGMETVSTKNLGGLINQLHAGQRNFFGL